MRLERFDSTQPLVSFTSRIQSYEEALAEFRRPCYRFKSPITTEEKLQEFIAERLQNINPLQKQICMPGDGVPLNWQRLLSFLHAQKVIESPSFARRRIHNDRPHVFNFGLTAPATKTSGRHESYDGFGGSLSKDEAISKAVGEMLERYFLWTFSPESLLRATPAQLSALGRNALDLRRLNGFLDWQKERFPRLGYNNTSEIFWIEGSELATQKSIYLPAQMVFWDYFHPDLPDERILLRQTTSGTAGHFTKDEAILAALLEAIQRDGFLIYWLNSLSPKVIATEMIEDQDVKDYLAYLHRYNLEVVFLDTTSDIGIPTATCVIIDHLHPDGPTIALGSSTGFDLKGTIIHSAIEALIVSNYVASLKTTALPNPYIAFSDPNIGRLTRLGIWKGEEMYNRFKFFLSGPRENPESFLGKASALTTPVAQLSFLLDRLTSLGQGYEVYIYEAKHKVLETLGYHVVRTIVPQLIPLHLVEHAALLDSKRLREVPAKLGYKAANEFNPWPHPFP